MERQMRCSRVVHKRRDLFSLRNPSESPFFNDFIILHILGVDRGVIDFSLSFNLPSLFDYNPPFLNSCTALILFSWPHLWLCQLICISFSYLIVLRQRLQYRPFCPSYPVTIWPVTRGALGDLADCIYIYFIIALPFFFIILILLCGFRCLESAQRNNKAWSKSRSIGKKIYHI